MKQIDAVRLRVAVLDLLAYQNIRFQVFPRNFDLIFSHVLEKLVRANVICKICVARIK